MTAAVSIRFQNVAAFSTAWQAAPRAAEFYVGELLQKLKLIQQDEVPQGVDHVHPLSKRARKSRSSQSRMRKGVRVRGYVKKGLQSEGHAGVYGIAHAPYVTFGTRPHAIEFRRAKVLTIWDPGGNFGTPDEYGFVLKRRVMHGGSKPNRWRRRSAVRVSAAAGPLWQKAMTRAVAKTKTSRPADVAAPTLDIRSSP